MRRLARSPLTWMLVAEGVLLIACAVLAWHVYVERTGAGAPLAALPAPLLSPSSTPSLRSSPTVPALPAARPTPAQPPAHLDLAALLDQLNRDQSARERLEADLVKTLSEAVRAYVERVVVPAVERALGG